MLVSRSAILTRHLKLIPSIRPLRLSRPFVQYPTNSTMAPQLDGYFKQYSLDPLEKHQKQTTNIYRRVDTLADKFIERRYWHPRGKHKTDSINRSPTSCCHTIDIRRTNPETRCRSREFTFPLAEKSAMKRGGL